MIFRSNLTPSLRLALPKCRGEGTPDLSVYQKCDTCGAYGGEHAVRRCTGSACVEVVRHDGSPLSADEAALVRVLLGGAMEKVS